MSFSARGPALRILFLVSLLVLGAFTQEPRVRAAGGTAIVSLPDTTGTVGDRLRLPIDIRDADSVEAARIDVVFDSTIAVPLPLTLEQGDFGRSIDATWGANRIRDTLRVAFFTADTVGYVGTGTWVTLEWDLVGAGTTPLRIVRIELERLPDIVLPATAEDGSMDVDPTAVEEGSWGRVKHRFATTP